MAAKFSNPRTELEGGKPAGIFKGKPDRKMAIPMHIDKQTGDKSVLVIDIEIITDFIAWIKQPYQHHRPPLTYP